MTARSIWSASGASLRTFAQNQRGATAIEYGLLVGGLGVVICVASFAVGDELKAVFLDRILANWTQ